MTVIYAISDMHGNLPEVPLDCEVLLIGGDICPDFRVPKGHPDHTTRYGIETCGIQQGEWLDTTFRAWLQPLVDDGIEVYAIWGNHDFVGETEFVPDLPWYLLRDDTCYLTVDDQKLISLHGTPWVPGLPYWAFYGTDQACEARAEGIPPNVDILLSHGPPRDAGDLIPGGEAGGLNKYGNRDDLRVGDIYLRKLCDGPNGPKTLICGHIHEDRGYHQLNETTVINVAAVDGYYDLVENPFTRIYV